MSRDSLDRKLAELDPRSERYRALLAARDFKASWVRMAEALHQVQELEKHLEWGFHSFDEYCEMELRISPRTAQKLLKSYQFLNEHEPEAVNRGADDPRERPEVPDVAQVAFLARARKDERVPEPVYKKLRDAAFRDGATVTELRTRLKEAVPEAPKPRPARDSARALRVALSHVARTLEVLSEVDGLDDELIRLAEKLRDELAHRLPRTEERAAG
ncbi:MAG: hypothetical protein HY904_02865 [Deltaproteobacteria bacterium]|nr:hypothetical protein [Deltaproteobacteria bacterium]